MARRILALTAASLAFTGAGAAEAPLFVDASPLDLVLEIPLQELKREDRGIAEDGVAVLSDGTTLDVEFETRGHSRLETCRSVPPLWVNFRKKQVDDTVFAGQNKLKLVTHCNVWKSYDELVAAESLNYRILSLLTEASYRIRVASVTYIDRDDDKTIGPRHAFLIEHKDGFAARMGLESHEVDGPTGINPRQLDPRHSALFGVFAFMISHLDWSTIRGSEGDACCHNAHLFRPPGWVGEEGHIIGVGYDFDLTGSVNPPYGEPPMGLRSFSQRKYRGWCWDRTLIDDAISRTIALKSEIEELIMTETRMSERRRKRTWRFLEGYFEIVEDVEQRERLIHDDCRKLAG